MQPLETLPEIACLSTLSISEAFPKKAKLAPATGSSLESVTVIVTVADPTWGGSGSTLRVWVQGRLFVRIGSEAV